MAIVTPVLGGPQIAAVLASHETKILVPDGLRKNERPS